MRSTLLRSFATFITAIVSFLMICTLGESLGPRQSRGDTHYLRPYPGYTCTATGGQGCLVCPPNPAAGDEGCGDQGPGGVYAVGNCNTPSSSNTCWIWTQYCGEGIIDCVTGVETQTFGGPCNQSPNYCANS